MNKYRLQFSKTGRAVYASHLDLMRTLRRAFRRADVDLRHSEGFNPHPLMSVILPLSVGQESVCELLDFETTAPCDLVQLPERLNAVLPEGIRALRAYVSARKASALKWVAVEGELRYDTDLPDITSFAAIFRRETLILSKKTKRGETEFDLITAVRDVKFATDGSVVTLKGLVSARDPVLNPTLLVSVLEPQPDFASFRRTALFDDDLGEFR